MTYFKRILAMILLAWFASKSIAVELPTVASASYQQKSRPSAELAPLFELLRPESTNVDFIQPIDLQHPKKYLYVGGYASAGVAIGDLNGDDLPDLVFTGGPVENRLYLQTANTDGKLQFVDATKQAGVAGRGNWSAGVTLVDIDADRDLDIYICNYDQPNELYINQTASPDKPRFQESAAKYGLDIVDASFQSTFCDYDSDGDLDVLVTGYQYVNPAGRPGKVPVRQIDNRYEVLPDFQKYYAIVRDVRGKQVFRNVGRRDYLLQNLTIEEGETKFRDVTEQAGISGRGVANSAIWWDYDSDGHPDIFVANDFKIADQLWHNNGDGTFTDVVKTAFPHITWFSMGSDVGDVNNDGLLDLFVSDMAGTSHYRSKVTMGEMGNNQEFLKYANPQQYMRNALFINTGTARFLEAAYLAGLANSDWTWTVKLADFDNDGRVDVYITNGAARMFNHSDFQATNEQRIGKTQWALWENMPPRKEENLAFRNAGNFSFEDVGQDWGLTRASMSYAAAHGDLDNDGDLDIVVANLDEPVSIYRNQSARNNSIRVKLLGVKKNSAAWGAQVQIETEEGLQIRQHSPSTGFLSCNESVLHFGLGAQETVDRMVISWPSGQRQTLAGLQANRVYEIRQSESSQGAASEKLAAPWFRPSQLFPALQHKERPYDDYARQPLLPYAHSQLGPGLSVADVDGDGDWDYYHGKAKGSRRAVYEQRPDRIGVKTIFAGDEAFEDMGSLFFDADRDGDQDLFVVSGSVECDANDESLQDRLYVNDGNGNLNRAPSALPNYHDSGSVVCGADYDQDGDIDLFVGGRVIPGKYPVTPRSHFLENTSENKSATFADRTEEVAPGLSQTGLVTSAVWADMDQDGWQDLVVTHEWGPVKLYRNEPLGAGRSLVDRTEEAGLAQRLGWWNGIAAQDLDNDGDVDFVVTNFGLNTTYHASFEKPELLYFGDFDDSGSPNLLEAKFEADKCFPRRGLSCSSNAMPFIRDKMTTFRAFGSATLDEIYTPAKLADALLLKANTLESGVLINTSQVGSPSIPKFEFIALPRIAQISPSFGVTIQDFDSDGVYDVFLAQNFFSPQVETGHMDGGVGLLMRGVLDRTSRQIRFEPVWPRESGILVPADATAVVSIDFNLDGALDLLVAVNDGPLQVFEGRLHENNRHLQISLQGPPGNLDCIGARVTVTFTDETQQARSVHAGGGYLTQEGGPLFFGCGTRKPKFVRVRWPNNQQTQHLIADGQTKLTLDQPLPDSATLDSKP